MAHFARIEGSDPAIVVDVVVVNNAEADTEAEGILFCQSIYGADANFVQTSYNASTNGFRNKYACVGDTWDGEKFRNPEMPADFVYP